MEMKEQVEGPRPTIYGTASNFPSNGGAQSDNVAKLPDTPAGNSLAPKARKPYTITKQREKWTEEEHQKFLEALKLYGRGWRQIEEHIGSKTAVQIRSHAQKFFSKVVRESDGSAESSIQPIAIPPPRPKRKPLHPYPRKSADSFKGQTIPNEPEKSPSANLSGGEKETQSPTSVLSAFGSEALGSAFSEQTNRCLSPNSCTTDIHSMSLSPAEKDNDYMTSKPAEEEEKGSLASVNLTTSLNPLVCMKSEIGAEETEGLKEDATNMPPISSIKLFGRTVSTVGNLMSMKVDDENIKPETIEMDDVENEKVGQVGASEPLDTQLSLGLSCGKVTSIEHLKENLCSSEDDPDSSLPSLSLYQGSAFNLRPCNHEILNPMPLRPCLKVRAREEESSCTGSNTESVGKNSDTADSKPQKYHEDGVAPQKSGRGFVPYKRCLAERDANSLIVGLEEREGQRARLCS